MADKTEKTANKGGAPVGSMNGLKNGSRISRLILGQLPTKMRRQLQNARKYRRGLEQAVVDIKGEVSLLDAHLIDEASGAEVHASVCRWLLRTRLEKMSTSDIARCSEQIMKSRTVRNKAVQAIGLHVEPEPLTLVGYLAEAEEAEVEP